MGAVGFANKGNVLWDGLLPAVCRASMARRAAARGMCVYGFLERLVDSVISVGLHACYYSKWCPRLQVIFTLGFMQLAVFPAVPLLFPACNRGNPTTCVSPKGVPGEHSRISFGDGKLTASILSVQTQCLPVFHPAETVKEKRTESYTDFEIAVTLKVESVVTDLTWLRAMQSNPFRQVKDSIRLEAIAETGVVVATGTALCTPILGGAEGSKVSTERSKA